LEFKPLNEAALIEKLMKIEALFAGAATEGERISADRARRRILTRLKELLPKDPPVEYRFTFPDMWSRKVFVALLRRYGLIPYRFKRQRYTTVMAKVPKSFVDDTLWPEYENISSELQTYLEEVTNRVVSQVLHEDSSDAMVVDEPLQISQNSDVFSEVPTPPEEKIPDPPPAPEAPQTTSPEQKKKKRKKKKRGKR